MSESRMGPGRLIWLLVAFLPAALIIMCASASRGDIQGGTILVAYGINPLISCSACFMLFKNPGEGNLMPAMLGIGVGAMIAILNFLIGVFGGCLCGNNPSLH